MDDVAAPVEDVKDGLAGARMPRRIDGVIVDLRMTVRQRAGRRHRQLLTGDLGAVPLARPRLDVYGAEEARRELHFVEAVVLPGRAVQEVRPLFLRQQAVDDLHARRHHAAQLPSADERVLPRPCAVVGDAVERLKAADVNRGDTRDRLNRILLLRIEQILERDLETASGVHTQYDGTRALVCPEHDLAGSKLLRRWIAGEDILPQGIDLTVGVDRAEAVDHVRLIEGHDVGPDDGIAARGHGGRLREQVGRGQNDQADDDKRGHPALHALLLDSVVGSTRSMRSVSQVTFPYPNS